MMSYKIRLLLYVCLIFHAGRVYSFDTLKITASLDTLDKQIVGTVKYRLPAEPRLTTFEFQLFPNVYSSDSTPYLSKQPRAAERLRKFDRWGSMEIDSIMLNGQNLSGDLSIDYTRGILSPSDERALNDSEITIYFKTVIPRLGDRLSYHENSYLLDGWFPTAAIIKADGSWYNPFYGPACELVGSFYNYEVSFRVPPGFVVAAPTDGRQEVVDNGKMIQYDYLFGPAHDFALAISTDYLVDSSKTGETDVLIYYRQFELPIVKRIREAVSRTMEYMEDHCGPYTYNSLRVVFVDVGFSGGIEFPAMFAVAFPGGGLSVTRLYELLSVHETIHQWFYGMLASDQIETPWMDESIASHFTNRIMKHYWSEEANFFDYFGFKVSLQDRFRVIGGTVSGRTQIDRSAYSFADVSEFFNTMYNYGSRVIETIENLMGDSVSSIFWKTYYNRFFLKRPDYNSFINTVYDVAGDDIGALSDELLNRSEKLDYSIINVANERIDSASVSINVELSAEGFLDYPIDYRIYLANGDSLDFSWLPEYCIEEKIHEADFPATSVVIDPDYKYAIDVNLLNNSFIVNTDNRAGFRLSSGLIYIFETLFSYLGGF
jgi:hypothetical protein